jgi:hypothetical protein
MIANQLRVYPAWPEDRYKDLARVAASVRQGIRDGQICRLTVNSRSILVILREVAETLNDGVLLDPLSQENLGVTEGFRYDVSIEPVSLLLQLRWACTVADPSARIAAWLGLAGIVLGAVGVVLGIVGVLLALK